MKLSDNERIFNMLVEDLLNVMNELHILTFLRPTVNMLAVQNLGYHRDWLLSILIDTFNTRQRYVEAMRSLAPS